MTPEVQAAYEHCMKICDEMVLEIEKAIPNPHGGWFAKKFAANSVRATRGRINQAMKAQL